MNGSNFANKCVSYLNSHIAEVFLAGKTQDNVFEDIVVKNRNTAYAKDNGFSSVVSFAEYRNIAPISTYENFEPYILKSAHGELDQLTHCQPYMGLKTSGTTGNSKVIPKNKHWRISYRAKAIYAQWGLYEKLYPGILKDWEKVIDLSWHRQNATEYVGKFPWQSITNRQAIYSENDWLPPWYNSKWFGASNNTLLAHMEQVIRHFFSIDVQCIVVVNPSSILLLDQILRDLSSRLLYEKCHIDDVGTNKQKIGRLTELIKNQGFFGINDLWPNIKFISCWKSGGASLYINSVKELVPGVRILPFSSLGTEGVVAIPVDDKSDSIVLALNQGLYEFIPRDQVGGSEHVMPKTFDELSIGETYQLVTTQANGLYRYNTEDFYRVVEYVRDVPRIEYVGRGNNMHSFTGEKLSESDLISAINSLENEFNINISPFYCIPVWNIPPYYEVHIIDAASIYSAEILKIFSIKIDQSLSKVNGEYHSKRLTNRLGLPIVRVSSDCNVNDSRESFCAQKISGLQKKHKIMRDRITAKSLVNF